MTNNQLTKEWLQNRIADMESTRDDIPFGFDESGNNELAAFKLALAAMDSEPVAEVVSIYGDGETIGEREIRPLIGIQQLPYGTKLYRHAQPAPVVVPEGLNPETTDLVLRFASALADKLYKAEQKYGRSTDWMKDDWYDDCLQSLWEHIEKGDPRDVAAYCAFMWYHGWVTTDYDRNVQNACRAAMLQPLHTIKAASSLGSLPKTGEVLHTNSPVIPDGYVMVPMRLTAENGAKGVLSGEFSETKFVNCPECFGDDECETCDGSGRIEIKVPVSWTTIKDIWIKGVEHFAAAPQENI